MVFHVKQTNNFDVVVVGGGHAGVEAAYAATKLGAKTLIVTFSEDDLGQLSCNPAIGGLGKGHLVREIDALGGVMGQAADLSGIQFRILNKSRGEAVQGPRAQIDRNIYKESIKKIIHNENIEIKQDEVVDIHIQKDQRNHKYKVSSVTLKNFGKTICGALIVTTGTFLSGKIYCGNQTWLAGRLGGKSSSNLPKFFKNNKFLFRRLKTGTPARLCARSINYHKCTPQYGDTSPSPFSFLNKKLPNEQVECFITHTNELTHKIIQENIEHSPIYNGKIKTAGPRYCPSIEDKVIKFSQRGSHQIFLEPETKEKRVIYPNGISTSLPKRIQERFLRSINGLENAKIIKYGYAVEYDSIDGSEIKKNYESKKIGGLFLAGQINGTTGYEEAAAQGLLAGVNAARKLAGLEEFILSRDNSYLGVLTDDITTGGFIEPYRMFTSRAEYRIQLRADNADERLTDFAIQIGLCCKKRHEVWKKKKKTILKVTTLLLNKKATPQTINTCGLKINMDGKHRSAYDVLGYKGSSWETIIKIWPDLKDVKLDKLIKSQIKVNAFYEKYVKRQNIELSSLKRDRLLQLKSNIDYDNLSGISNEAKESLKRSEPTNIAEASQLPGMTPAATAILLRYLKKTG